jgi:shikimate kinase/3-dehydroquinate synthase
MAISAKVRVELAERSYEVVVGVDLLEAVGDFVWPFARGRRTVVITDTVVGLLYAQRVSGGLTRAGCRNDVIVMPAGERHKNLQTYGEVVNRLLGLSPPIDRRTLIVALGGGVVGDLAGFVAATALRGLNFVMVPTTLLPGGKEPHRRLSPAPGGHH